MVVTTRLARTLGDWEKPFIDSTPSWRKMFTRASRALHYFQTNGKFPGVHRAGEFWRASQIPRAHAKYRGSGAAGRRASWHPIEDRLHSQPLTGFVREGHEC